MKGKGANLRRAYDADGNEIPPATVASTRALGYRTVVAFCDPCGHDAAVPLDRFPADLPIPDIALKVRCSACGSKRILIHLNVSETQPNGQGTTAAT